MCALFVALIIVLLLILIIALPITLRFRFIIGDGDHSFQWQLSFLYNFIHKEFHIIPREKIIEQMEKRGGKKLFLLVQLFLKRMRFWQIDAFLLLGTGDAAYTALCCGLLDATLNALGSVFLPRGKKGRGWLVRTTPSFNAAAFQAQIHGIFRFCLAQIILAALAWRNAQNIK